MYANLPRQRQQRQGTFECDAVGAHAARQGCALRLLLAFGFAELRVDAVRPLPQRDRQSGLGIVAEAARDGRTRPAVLALARPGPRTGAAAPRKPPATEAGPSP